MARRHDGWRRSAPKTTFVASCHRVFVIVVTRHTSGLKRLRMQRPRETARGGGDTRTGRHQVGAGEHDHALGAHGGQRGQRLPGAEVDGAVGLDVQLDDDLRRGCQQRLTAGLHGLALLAGEDVGGARDLEHVVQEAHAAARVEVAKRAGLAAEHQQRPRPVASGDARADVRQVAFDCGRHVVRACQWCPCVRPARGWSPSPPPARRACTRTPESPPATAAAAGRAACRRPRPDRAAAPGCARGRDRAARRRAAAGRPPAARGRSCSRRPRAVRRRWQTASPSPPAPARRSVTAAPARSRRRPTCSATMARPTKMRPSCHRAFVPS